MTPRTRLVLIGALYLTALTVVCTTLGPLPRWSTLTRDFIQYWSGFQLAFAGQNPYDFNLLAAFQAAVPGPADAPSVRMLNVPWILVIFAPLLCWSFTVSAVLWLHAKIALLFVAARMSWSLYSDKRPQPFDLMLALLLFPPIINDLMIGQVGAFIAFFTIGFVYWSKRNRPILAGCCLCALSIKPHLVLLLVVAVSVQLLRERKFSVFVSAVAALLCCILLTKLLFPELLLHYWGALTQKPSELTIAATESRVDTLVGLVRSLLLDATGDSHEWLFWAVPAVTTTLTALITASRKDLFASPNTIPALLVLTIFLSPYGWTFDQSMLCLIPVALLARQREAGGSDFRGLRLRVLILGVYALGFLSMAVLRVPHSFTWYPLAMWCLWRLTEGGHSCPPKEAG